LEPAGLKYLQASYNAALVLQFTIKQNANLKIIITSKGN